MANSVITLNVPEGYADGNFAVSTTSITVARPPRFSPLHMDSIVPTRATKLAVGYDLHAYLPTSSPLVLKPGARALIPTGVRLEMHSSMEAQVRPRSGLASWHGVTVLNAPGTIDPDYTGEIRVILINHGEDPFEVEHEMRIAQVVFGLRYELPEVTDKSGGADVVRADGGFGSTGT